MELALSAERDTTKNKLDFKLNIEMFNEQHKRYDDQM